MQSFIMPTEAAVGRAAADLRLLADPTRLKILWALVQGESNVGCLADLAGVSATSVSQHLAKLRLSGLVQTRREGTFVYYSVTSDWVTRLLTDALTPTPPSQPTKSAAKKGATKTRRGH
jgi:DNA-binding transcriptional ArsR family regulator